MKINSVKNSGFANLLLLFIVVAAVITTGTLIIPGSVKSAQGAITPLLFRCRVDPAYNAGIKQNPLPAATVTYLQGLASKCDLVLMDVNAPSYYPLAYAVMHQTNPDIVLQEYGNPSNWAGDLFNLSDVPESWFLHYPNTNSTSCQDRLISPFYPVTNSCTAYNEWDFDMGNPAFQQFFASKVVAALQGGVDSLEIDNGVLPKYYMGEGGQYTLANVRVVPINPRTGVAYTYQQWDQQYVDMARTVRQAVDAAFPSGISKNGVPISLHANGAAVFDSYYASVQSYAWQAWDYYKGMLTEVHFFSPTNYNGYSLQTWIDQLAGLQTAMKKGYPINAWDVAADPFIYASILLGAGTPTDRFYAADASDWAGYRIDLGTATGDYYKFPGSTNVYARQFTKALVLVNPSTNDETVNPGVSYKSFSSFPTGLSPTSTTAPIIVGAKGEQFLMLDIALPTSTPIPGDADGNGVVNTLDIRFELVHWFNPFDALDFALTAAHL